jgi:hypothetical protein
LQKAEYAVISFIEDETFYRPFFGCRSYVPDDNIEKDNGCDDGSFDKVVDSEG